MSPVRLTLVSVKGVVDYHKDLWSGHPLIFNELYIGASEIVAVPVLTKLV